MTAPGSPGLLTRAATVAQVVVDDLDAPVLDDADVKHVGKVLRARPGELVCLVDGKGRWRIGKWSDGSVDPIGEIVAEPATQPVTVCLAVLKGERTEWAVQKLTEVGVDRIILLTESDHGVVRWDNAKRDKNLQRLSRVAHEAAMQSRRTVLPSVEFLRKLDDLPSGTAIAHPGGAPLGARHACVAIGSEGGWSEREVSLGFEMIDLGHTIMRAETASVAVGVRMCAQRQR